MLNQLCTALDALEDMTDKHQFVSLKTQSLHDACEKLVEEQVHLYIIYLDSLTSYRGVGPCVPKVVPHPQNVKVSQDY